MIDPRDRDFGAVINCAIRYCLGRETYMPHLVMDYVRPLLSELDNKTLAVIVNDIEGAPSLGHTNIDVPAWQNFLAAVKAELQHRREQDLEQFKMQL